MTNGTFSSFRKFHKFSIYFNCFGQFVGLVECGKCEMVNSVTRLGNLLDTQMVNDIFLSGRFCRKSVRLINFIQCREFAGKTDSKVNRSKRFLQEIKAVQLFHVQHLSHVE